MSIILQPEDIADCFSLEEIELEISGIMSQIRLARQSRVDQFDDMQARQKVERQSLEDLRKELSVWIKAKQIKTGSEVASAELIAGNYNPVIPRI